MNDTQNTTPATQESVNTTAPVPAPTPTPTAVADPTTKAKKRSKSRRTRTRRRAVASDQESGDEGGAGNQSDSSLSSRSDAPNSESEDEPAPKPAPTAHKAKGSKSSKTPVFADVSSITPPGWSGKNGDDVTPISFEDFNAGKEAPETPVSARGTGLSIRGRGKGKVETATRREYTPEETAKYEAQKAKRKEKVKAKRAALKEEKQQKETTGTKAAPTGDSKTSDPVAPLSDTKVPTSAPETSTNQATKPTKAKGKKKNESASAPDPAPTPSVDDITASTSAITLDTPAAANATESATSAPDATPSAAATDVQDESPSSSAQQRQPPRQPRGNAREAQAQRAAQDPKFTPRAGQFWTHDQRLYEGGNAGDGYNNGPRQIGPFFRGRAIPRGAYRGNMRGRGRGGFLPNVRGGFANGGPPRNVELSQEEEKVEGSSKLAMDREYELAEARDKARAAPPAPQQVETQAEEGAGEGPSDSAPPQPPAPSSDRKWGHEGYEAMSAPVAGQVRGAYRGRVRGAGPGVRGRGAFFPRGGHLPFAPPHRQMRPAQLAAAARAQVQAHLPAPPAAAATIPSSAIESQPATVAAKDHEQMSTQPTADSLLDPADESFKIKFPGSAASTVPAAPSPVVSSAPVPPTAPSTTTEVVTPATADIPSVQAPSVSAPSPAPQASEPQFPSLHTGSPAPVAAVQAQMYTGGSNHSIYQMGSENGSVGSGHFVQHPSQFYPPEYVPNGMAMQQRPGFYPQHSHRGYPAQSPGFYPPQSPYSPGPYEPQQQPHPHHHAQHPHPHQRGSFSGAPMTSPQGVFFPQGQVNGYANGRSSPLNPYMNMNQSGGGGGGFFAPVRATNKVAIRAPNQNQDQNGDGNGNESSEIGAVVNGSAPTTNGSSSGPTSGDAYQAQHYNPYVQPFVPGQRRQDETTYYPLTNGQQYGWQGYNGEQGYYEGGVNYGY